MALSAATARTRPVNAQKTPTSREGPSRSASGCRIVRNPRVSPRSSSSVTIRSHCPLSVLARAFWLSSASLSPSASGNGSKLASTCSVRSNTSSVQGSSTMQS
eukprot:4490293-Prymnesium_polylepis.1